MSTPDRTASTGTPRRLSAAVIGLGRIGFAYHAPALADHAHFTLAAAVDPDPARRAEAETRWGLTAFPDLDALLAHHTPDLVVIASPTPFHREQAVRALRAGCHVVCDKPVATSLADFDAMAAAATDADRRLIAYQPARFHPSVLTLQTLLRRGTLGPIHTVVRHRCNFSRRNDWQAFTSHGGGMLNNYGSHCLDEILCLLDAPAFTSVQCTTRRLASVGDAEDHVKAVLRSADGVLVDLTISQADALENISWQIHGAHGSAAWHESADHWRVRAFDPARHPAPPLQTGLAARDRCYQTESIDWTDSQVSVATDAPLFDFYGAVHAALLDPAAPPPITLAESRRLLELIARCRASAASGDPG